MDNVFELFAKITLDSKDFEKSLKNVGDQLKKIPDTINKAGATISNFGKGISAVGDKLTNSITKPAIAAGTAVGAIFIAKGWSRLTQIDEAKAKLRGLGHDAESVQNIMESALASVKGTAFGMDEAATTAASAVAAGIKQGEDLTRYLKSVGDAAAIANVPMADMGSIFNKVATSGKAQGEVLAQLADRGIPIYSWLAEAAGVAGDQVAEMAKDGEINLELFRKAVEKNVGGAALQLGNATLTGALANVGAAISRVGANFLGAADDANSFAGKLLPVLIKAQDKLGILEDKAKEWGGVFGEIFQKVIDYFSGVKDGMDEMPTAGAESIGKLSETAQKAWNVIEPILDAIKSVIEYFKSGQTGALDSLAAGAGELAKTGDDINTKFLPALAGIALGMGPVLKYGGQIINIIGLVVQNGGLLIAGVAALTATLAYLTATGKDTTGVFQFISDGIAKLGEIIPGVAQNIMNGIPAILGALQQIIPQAISVATQIISSISETLITGLPEIMKAGGELLKAIGEGIVQNLPELVRSAADLITTFADGLASALPTLIPMAYEIILTLVDSLLNNTDKLIDSALNLIMALANGLINALPILIEKGPVIVQKLVDAIVNNLPKIMATGGKLVATLVTGIVTNLPQILNGGMQIVTSLYTGIYRMIPKIKAAGIEAIEYFRQGIKNLNPAQWGSDMIDNFISGIKASIGKVKSAASDIAQTVKNVLGFSEPEEGPLSNFHTYAPDMMKLFAKGIADNENMLRRQVESSFDFGDVMVNAKPTMQTSGGGNIYITVNGAEGQSEERLAQIVSDRLLHELNMKKAVVPTYA